MLDKHNSIRQGRSVGLFGCMDIIDETGNLI